MQVEMRFHRCETGLAVLYPILDCLLDDLTFLVQPEGRLGPGNTGNSDLEQIDSSSKLFDIQIRVGIRNATKMCYPGFEKDKVRVCAREVVHIY